MNQIIVLSEGYSKYEQNEPPSADAPMLANCTCTLIKGPDCNVIVDTMTPWDGDLLLQRLQEHQLHPDDIDYVVSTHGHSDHLGNNNLFLRAKRHIVGTNISHRNRYYVHDFDAGPYRLTDDIEVQATPGHTLSCVTVLVAKSNLDERRPVAIAGDLFERQQDIEDERLWLEACVQRRSPRPAHPSRPHCQPGRVDHPGPRWSLSGRCVGTREAEQTAGPDRTVNRG